MPGAKWLPAEFAPTTRDKGHQVFTAFRARWWRGIAIHNGVSTANVSARKRRAGFSHDNGDPLALPVT
jgi:hypothetical protein